MSVQFGKCNFDSKPVSPADLHDACPVLEPYGPDGEGYLYKDNFAVLYRSFHTTKESRREVQPHITMSGAVLTWDGRLDNREELTGLLANDVSARSTDLEIVAAAYDRWRTDSFAKLVGDWALSVWDSSSQNLILAKDFIGTRHLFYLLQKDQVTWCTILDPLVLFAKDSFSFEEEYFAGWLSFFPAPHLTPYAGIRSVPPSHFVRLGIGTHAICRYWDFDSAKSIVYRDDSEYEEHFRTLFANSVRHRVRSDSPILAELSGGMDSSSIVCMADHIARRGLAETPRIDTVSYYDDLEPNWNERPYFSKVEELRGRAGCHIDTSATNRSAFCFDDEHFAVTPSSRRPSSVADKRFAYCMRSQGNRVLISGIGGDEVLGGIPSPIPELADLLTGAHITQLVRQLTAWALAKRKPLIYLFFETAGRFLRPSSPSTVKQSLAWLNHDFVSRQRKALTGYPRRFKFFGPMPTFQENQTTLDALRRQMGCTALPLEPTFERRYPYLDRTLLEFVYSIPRDQLLRPGHRRSLMRRALRAVVPDETLNRRRKAYVSRAPLKALTSQWSTVFPSPQQSLAGTLLIIDNEGLSDTVKRIACGEDAPTALLIRAFQLETWLSHIVRHVSVEGILSEENQAVTAGVVQSS